VAGTFRVELDGWKLEWSDGMFELHGYQRGDVVPTLELLYSHKHPEDRPRCEEIVAQVCRTGGYFCMYHRIIDARGRTRRVLTSGDAIMNAEGIVTSIEGVMVDLTSSTRSVIDQARGILMGQLGMGSEDAFQMLVSTSSHRNVKLVVVAAELVQLANSEETRGYLPDAVLAIQQDGRRPATRRRAS
jgi:hypothetical protein